MFFKSRFMVDIEVPVAISRVVRVISYYLTLDTQRKVLVYFLFSAVLFYSIASHFIPVPDHRTLSQLL